MKKVVLTLMVAGAVSLVSADGAAAFAKCAGCHGKDGKKSALNKSAVIAGQDAAKTVEQLKGYKAGTLNTHGMGSLMKGQVSGLDDAAMKELADYIAGLK